jgi:3-oxoacyl-[acyl-carrier protein] reductase
MDLGLAGKVALVTGGSRGLGLGMVRALAREGCAVAVCARGEEALRTAVAQVAEETGATVAAFPCDITASGAGEQLVREVTGTFGGLDIVVHNAGGNRRKELTATTDADWEELARLNLHCHVGVSRAAVPALRARGGGAMLFVASIFGREAGGAGLAIYNATKSALISVAKILSLEVAADGIRVNSIAPGSIRFPGGSWDKRALADPEGIAEFVRQNLPLGRFGTVEEVADVVTFLVSPRASLITGACIQVDGGQSRSLI